MSNNLWNRVADFFKEWDGEDMTKSMLLYVDELREINSNRIELIRLERERKEIRNKAIEEFTQKAEKSFDDFESKYGLLSASGCRVLLTNIAEQMKEAGE